MSKKLIFICFIIGTCLAHGSWFIIFGGFDAGAMFSSAYWFGTALVAVHALGVRA